MSEITKIEMMTDLRNAPGSSIVAELQIPVPWGHIAAKTWGDPSCHPVLCLHGELENAASFDRLIPLLPLKQFYYVCLDLPGHGRSSHVTPGVPYRFVDYLVTLKRVVNHFSWNKLHILGHNLGGLLGLYFAAAYPDSVLKLILVDCIYPVLSKHHVLIDKLRQNFESVLSSERNDTIPEELSYQSLYEKLLSWKAEGSSVPAIDACISRNAQRAEDGSYILRMDPRVRWIEYPYFVDTEFQVILKNIKCELLVLTAKDLAKSRNILPVTSLLYIFRYKCPRFEHQIVEGSRDLHLNFPARLGPIIGSFLQYARNNL